MRELFSQQNIILKKLFHSAIENGVFPGAAVAIFKGVAEERRGGIFCYGESSYSDKNRRHVDEHTFYDLASLTKPMATLPALLSLMARGVVGVDDKLPDLLGEKIKSEKKRIRLRDILGHCSGLPSYLPFFAVIEKNEWKKKTVKEEIKKIILNTPLSYAPKSRSLYSDPGFILAGMIVEKQSAMGLGEYLDKKLYSPLGIEKRIFFNKQSNPEPGFYARGEYCHLRERLLQAEVGDENCFIMGHEAGHAGLFGDITGVSSLLCRFFDLWRGEGVNPFPFGQKDISIFFDRRENHAQNSTWALGVDTPSGEHSSAGGYISGKSVGHLGYSGTSFWLDPDNELVIILLTNRVHPCRSNEKIRWFRPLFHETIYRGVA